MRSCRHLKLNLTLSRSDVDRDAIIAAAAGPTRIRIAQLSSNEAGYFLENLFVDPACMGVGLGRKLFQWSVEIPFRGSGFYGESGRQSLRARSAVDAAV